MLVTTEKKLPVVSIGSGARVLRLNIAPKIAIIIFVVAVIGMLAIDLVVVIAQQRTMIDSRLQLATAATPLFNTIPPVTTSGFRPVDATIISSLSKHNISCVYLTAETIPEEPLIFGPDCQAALEQTAVAAMDEDVTTAFIGKTWGVFWRQPEKALLRVPVSSIPNFRDNAVLVIDLVPVYAQLRKMQGHLLIYVLINAVVLTYFGSLRIWQMTGRPIQRLAQRADAYRSSDAAMFQTLTDSSNDITRLSRSLNQMIHRLEADRQALKDSVASLEKANQELSRAQSDIIRAEKLASVGRLAAGIAHEIGNPMGIVTGYLELLKSDAIDGGQRTEFLQRAEEELNRINVIIRQLLDLARPAKAGTDTVVPLHRIITDVADVLRAQPMSTNIDIDLHLDAPNDSIYANEQSMRQVMLNLMLNAIDALTDDSENASHGRRLSITTQSLTSKTPPCLVIDVADDGPGIKDAHLPNLFDPFFTTKEPGKGTGLGLSVCYMIIDRIGGKISAENRVGGGTTVTLTLPLAEGGGHHPLMKR